MKKFYLAIVFIFSLTAYGQKRISLLCTNFKVNNEPREDGASYRKSLESVLSNLKYPPLIVDRENLPDLFIKIQEEANLNRDLNSQSIPALQAAHVEFIMYANFDKKLVNDTYDLQLECIKISGENSFSKKIFPILKLTEKEISNTDRFRQRLNDLLNSYAFTEDFGIIENDQLEEIKKRLDEKDLEIKALKSNVSKVEEDASQKGQTIISLSEAVSSIQNENIQKSLAINKLNTEIVNIKDYSNVAKLDHLGAEIRYGSGLTGWKSDLYHLMEQVIIETNGKIQLKNRDSSLLILDLVITKYPKFPFSYWAKSMLLLKKNHPDWTKYADKASEIFAITTTIEGHNNHHDKIFKDLKQFTDAKNNGKIIRISDVYFVD